jgi:2-oxoglutarate ferredoxin oxidoreductase subunit alpha
VQIQGDFLLAHTAEAVSVEPLAFDPLPAKDWAVDGSLGGSGRSRNINPIGMSKGAKGIEPESFWQRLQDKHEAMAAAEARAESESCEDAEVVVVAFGSLARFVRHAVRALRREGVRVGYVRPITLWPFPAHAVAHAAQGVRRVAVLEQNAGQMIDDVRLAVLGSAPVVAIGGISSDEAGFGIGPILNPDEVRRRITLALDMQEA